jgi:hypothetical protein
VAGLRQGHGQPAAAAARVQHPPPTVDGGEQLRSAERPTAQKNGVSRYRPNTARRTSHISPTLT